MADTARDRRPGAEVTDAAMLRRAKIIVVAYCLGGLLVLGMAVGLVFLFVSVHEETEDHEHYHGEPSGPEAIRAQTYSLGDKTFMKVPFIEKDLDVTQSCVDLREIFQVSIDQKKFPDLEELRFTSPEEADALPEEDAVLGTSIEGEERAYPIRMLNYHVVLNDSCAGREIAVVWEPLTMTAKVFRRRVEGAEVPREGGVLTFSKLALLYKGGLLLYDKASRSIWWPPAGKCLAGELSGTVLGEYPFLLAPWRVWKSRHPATTVLSTDTPFRNSYGRNLYESYYAMEELPLPVEGWDDHTSPFKWSQPVIALEAEQKARAYPLSVLAGVSGVVEDSFAGKKVVVHEPQSRLPYPTDEQGREIAYSFGAWFLWSVRYPAIEIYSPPRQTP